MTIRIGGGPSSSANYTTFAGIGNLITQDHPDYLINTEISTGSQENIRMIQSGTVQFGVAMTDVEEAAFKGTREFDGSPVEICHVMGGYTTMLHMFVPKDSDVNSISPPSPAPPSRTWRRPRASSCCPSTRSTLRRFPARTPSSTRA